MKLSKSKLKKLIEGYLFEDGDAYLTQSGAVTIEDLDEFIVKNNIKNFNAEDLYQFLGDENAYLIFTTPSVIEPGVSSLKFVNQSGIEYASFEAVSGHKDYFGSEPLETMATKGYPSRGIKGGPTPEGEYTLGDYQELGWSSGGKQAILKLLHAVGLESESRMAMADMDTEARKIAWGNHRYSLIPDPSNEMFMRDGMYIHGGKYPGSAGCIDLTDQMDEFSKIYEFWKTYTGKSTMKLIVDYPPIGKTVNYNTSKYGQSYSGEEPTSDFN